jgi:putative protease
MKKVKKVLAKRPAKKAVKKTTKKTAKKQKLKLVGKITHYFSDIKVAVINLVVPLKVGEKIRIIGGKETDFEQKVSSMQIEHEVVKLAKKGDSVGLKVDEKVHEGYKAYKL